MKKIYGILFVVFIIFSFVFVACSSNEEGDNNNATTELVDGKSILVRKITIVGLNTAVFAEGSDIIMSGLGIGGWTGWTMDTACVVGKIGFYGTFEKEVNFVSDKDFNFTGGLTTLPDGKNPWVGNNGDGHESEFKLGHGTDYSNIMLTNPKDGKTYDIVCIVISNNDYIWTLDEVL